MASPALDPAAGTLILTRPAAQAPDWQRRLAALGVSARSLPLLEIQPGAADQARAAWAALDAGADLAMFVSPNAVSALFAAQPPGAAWPARCWAATVGPGSAAALARAGVPQALILQPDPGAPSLDSEHLWPVIEREAGVDWRGRLALLMRGEGGREWLAQRLAQRGAQVAAFALYRRGCPRPDAAQQALLREALAHPRAHVWLFSSAEAVGHLPALAAAGTDWRASRAIATHERIAQRAQALGFGHVVLVRPDAGEVAGAFRRLSGGPLESSPL